MFFHSNEHLNLTVITSNCLFHKKCAFPLIIDSDHNSGGGFGKVAFVGERESRWCSGL